MTVKTFDTTSKDLAHLDSAQRFMLRREYEDVVALLRGPEPIQKEISLLNQDRIAELCHNAGRIFSFDFAEEDASTVMLRTLAQEITPSED